LNQLVVVQLEEGLLVVALSSLVAALQDLVVELAQAEALNTQSTAKQL
jgi:hypothetical protein